MFEEIEKMIICIEIVWCENAKMREYIFVETLQMRYPCGRMQFHSFVTLPQRAFQLGPNYTPHKVGLPSCPSVACNVVRYQ